MDTFLHDLRFALRAMLKARGFTLVAIVTLALGIGANTAMFTVIDAVLLRPLPFHQPDRIFAINSVDSRPGHGGNASSYPDFFDFRDRNHTLQDIAIYRDSSVTLSVNGEPQHIPSALVSAGFFEVLGVRPKLGRTFRRDEEKSGQYVAVLSDSLWRSRFNADPGIVGRAIDLGGRSFTVVGVMPPGFQFPVGSEPLGLWTSIARDNDSDPGDQPVTTERGAHFLQVIGRTKDGVTHDQATAELSTIAAALAQEYPDTNRYRTSARLQPLLEYMVGDQRLPLYVLFGAVGLVLLIACVNVANLTLARSTARQREIAIRAALGATTARIIRQLVTESVVLAVIGAAFGTAFATWSLAALVKLYPQNLPRLEQISVDTRVLLFTIAVALAAGVLFGLVPAWRSARPNLADAMQAGGRTSSGAQHNRLRSALVIAETALGVMLLVGAGLLIRSFDRLTRVDPGFDPARVLTSEFALTSRYHANEQQDQFYRTLLERLGHLPGVARAAGVVPLPLSDSFWSISFEIEGKPLPPSEHPSAAFVAATPGYFEALRVPVLRGRTFDERDQRSAAKVMIVSQAFAQQYFPGEDPIGKRMKPGVSDSGQSPWREIVGVVGDIRAQDLAHAPRPTYYLPLSQCLVSTPTLVVRTETDPQTVLPALRNVLHEMDPDVPLFTTRTMDDYLALAVGQAKFNTVLLSVFAGIALVLTAVGLYGVMAYSVVQRTREIGIRMALGASRGHVLGLVMRRGAILTGAGLVLGTAGAFGLTRFMRSMLFATRPADPLTIVLVCVVLSGIALLASFVPARRATRVDPLVTLRYE